MTDTPDTLEPAPPRPTCTVEGCPRLALTGSDRCARHAPAPPPAPEGEARPSRRPRRSGNRARVRLGPDEYVSADLDELRIAPGPLPIDVLDAIRRAGVPVTIERPDRPPITGRLAWIPLPANRRRRRRSHEPDR